MNDDPSQNCSVSITSGTIVKVILIAALFYVLFLLRDLVLIVLTSVVVAAAVEPAARWLRSYRVPRIPAVLLIYLGVLSVIAALFSLFIPPLLAEASTFLSSLPHYIETVNAWEPSTSVLGDQRLLNGEVFSLKDVINEIRQATQEVQGGILNIIAGIFGGLSSFLLIIILSFYLAVQENGIDEFLRLVTPVKYRDYVQDLWYRSQEKIGYWMQGQLLLIVLIGVLTYLGLMILGVEYALLLAILAGVMEIIPIFGPIIAAIPAVILAFVHGIGFMEAGLASGVAVALFYVLIQQFENNLIYPLVVQKVVGVPPIIVILGLIIGWQIAGFLGVILSVPVAAGIMEFMHDVQKGQKEREARMETTA